MPFAAGERPDEHAADSWDPAARSIDPGEPIVAPRPRAAKRSKSCLLTEREAKERSREALSSTHRGSVPLVRSPGCYLRGWLLNAASLGSPLGESRRLGGD